MLAAAAVIGDTVARGRVEATVEQRVADAAPGTQGVAVTIPGTPFLTQALGGQLGTVQVRADRLVADGPAGPVPITDLRVTLHDVTVSEPYTAGSLLGTGDVATADLGAQLGEGLELGVVDGVLTVTLTGIPLAAGMEATALGDAISLDVTQLWLADVPVAPEDLPFGIGAELQDLVVPLDLPLGLTLREVQVLESGVRVTVAGTDVALTVP